MFHVCRPVYWWVLYRLRHLIFLLGPLCIRIDAMVTILESKFNCRVETVQI